MGCIKISHIVKHHHWGWGRSFMFGILFSVVENSFICYLIGSFLVSFGWFHFQGTIDHHRTKLLTNRIHDRDDDMMWP